MTDFIFDLQLFDDPPEIPGGGGGEGGGENPGGGEGGGDNPGGGGDSSSVSWSAANSITSATVTSGQNYTSTSADENAVLISTTATVTLNNATVTKSGGTSASDNYSFYGINSAVMCMGGGTTSIVGGTVTTSAAGANGVFSYGANSGQTNATGDGTTVYIKDVTISTTAQGSGGIMTTYGGTTVAENLTITTEGGSSAPIRTDRGGGTVSVTGGSYTSNGLGSPAIYSTAEITVNDATLTSNQSEGVCIEGAGSIALSNCTLTANNTATNGNATFYDSIMIYQSQSGDASDGTSEFSMTGGTLNSQKGHVFHVTNTTAVINLDGVTINNSDSEGILLSVCDDGWSGADNVATLNASNQTLTGDILVGSDSTLTLNLEGSTFTGNISGEITNASGGTVSTTVGTVNVTLDDDSKWYLTGDTYISDFDGDAANVISNGFTLYKNGVAVDGTTSDETALNITNSDSNTLITGTSLNDTISNSGDRVTIDAADGNDLIDNGGAYVSISGGAGNDTVLNYHSRITIDAGADVDYIENGGAYVSISAGAGNDSILHYESNSTIDAGAGNDIISIESGNTNIITAGAGNDTIFGLKLNLNSTIDAGAGNNVISIAGGRNNVIISSGNDTLYNYSSSLGTIQAEVSSSAVDGDNVILTTSNGTLTIVDAKDDTLNINGNETVFSGESESETNTLAAYLADFALHKTEAGYPQMAELAFHPTEANPDAPTNYYSSETWTATSADDLTLSAVHYSPENPTGKWVILVHGYGKVGAAMNDFAAPYLAQGLDVLIIDQRAAGDSEGEWLTMGVAESADLAIWTQEIANTNSNAQITLHGVSMGAATVMLAAALSEITNVTSIIEDCGYSDISAVFNTLLSAYGSVFGISGDVTELIEDTFEVGESLTGYDVAQAVPLDVIAQVTVPSLFIHGAEDAVIPVSVANELYNLSGAEDKTLVTIAGAGHAVSSSVDSETYFAAVNTLLDNSTEEIGASINSTVDNKNVRGTIYNDTIIASGDNVTIDALTGGDLITAENSSATLSNATINLGEGADTLDFSGTLNQVTIFGSGSSNDIKIGTLENPVVSESNVTVGNRTNVLSNARTMSVISLNNDTASDFEIDNFSGAGLALYINNTDSESTNQISVNNITDDKNIYFMSVGGAAATNLNLGDVTGSEGSFFLDFGPGNNEPLNNNDTLTIGDISTSNDFHIWMDGGNDKIFIGNVDDNNSIRIVAINSVTAEIGNVSDNAAFTFLGGNEINSVTVGNVGDSLSFFANLQDGNDYLKFGSIGSNANITINGGGGADSFEFETVQGNVIITSGTPRHMTRVDSVRNSEITAETLESTAEINAIDLKISGIGANSTVNITGGESADNISIGGASSSTVVVSLGAGNDTVTALDTDNISVDAGEGDNYIFNAFAYYDSDGNFVAKNDNPNKSSSATIIAGAGNDTIANQGINNGVIDAGDGDNYIGLYHSYYNTITTGSGADSVAVDKGHYLNVSTGAGNDTIIGRIGDIEEDSWAFGGHATIDAGAGDDYIAPVYSNDSSIFGGAGNDTIIINGENSTINGGEGNDYIEFTNDSTGNYEAAVLVASAGNDTITNYSRVVTLQGDFTDMVDSDNNVILTSAAGTLTLANAKGRRISLLDSSGNFNSTVIGGDLMETVTINGVTYTPVDDDAALVYDEEGNVTGITAGTVEITLEDSTDPKITLDGTTGFDFTATATDGALKMQVGNNSISYTSGNITYTADEITFEEGTAEVTAAISILDDTDIELTIPASGGTISITDGEFSLGAGFALTKTFDSGNIVKVVANVDNPGEIKINDDGSISVTPSSADAVTVEETFTFGPVYNLNSIEGTLNISDNVLTFEEGTVSGTINVNGNEKAVTFTASEGSGSATVANAEMTYEAEDGATFTVQVDEDIMTINGGGTILSQVVDGEHSISLDAGINMTSITDYKFILRDAGTYTLNGNTVTTEKENVEVYLPDGDTIIFELADNRTLTISPNTEDSGTITVDENGGVTVAPTAADSMSVQLDVGNNVIHDYTSIDGSLTFSGNYVIFNGDTSIAGNVLVLNQERPFHYEVEGEAASLELTSNGNIISCTDGTTLTGEVNNAGSLVITGEGTVSIEVDDSRTYHNAYLSEGINLTSAADEYHFILETAGTYNLNGTEITSTEDNITVYLSNHDTITFDAGAGIEYEGAEITGAGKVQITDGEISLIMNEIGTATLDGQTFELITDVESGVTVSAIDGGYSVSHKITAEEVEMYGDPVSYIGKTFTENISIDNDDDYSIAAHSRGTTIVSGISNGAQIKVTAEVDGETYEPGTGFKFVTDEEGVVTFGESAVTISNDESVTFDIDFSNDGTASVGGVLDLYGVVSGNLNGLTKVNDSALAISNGADNATISNYDGLLIVSGITEVATVTTDDETAAVLMTAEGLTLNEYGYTLSSDSDGVVISADREILGLDANASLQVSRAGNYSVNDTELKAKANDTIIGVTENYAYIYDAENPQINSETTTEEILDEFKISDDKAVTLTDSDSYTVESTKGKNAVVVPETMESDTTITLGEGGDLAVIEATDAPVTVTGGAGNDSLVTAGEDVTFDMDAGGDDKIIATSGTVKLENYKPLENDAGIKLTIEDVQVGVKFDDGQINLANATVELENNFVNIYNPADELNKIGFATESNAEVDGSDSKDDLILIGGGSSLAAEVEDATLLGGSGNDTVYAGKGSYIDAGSGVNLIKMSKEGGSTVNFTEGVTVIDNFNFTDSEGDADTLQLEDEISKVKIIDGDVLLKNDNGRVQINDAENKNFQLADGDDTITVQISDKELNYDGAADKYIAAGKSASVTVGDIDAEKVSLSLDNDENSDAEFEGDFKYLDASEFSGAATLGGNDRYNLIKASAGGSVLNGGKGNDTLVGGEGADTFEYEFGDGKDIISNFEFGTGENADIVNTKNAEIESVAIDGEDLVLKFNDGGKIKIEDGANQNLQFVSEYTDENTIVAQVGQNELNYDGVANLYWAAGKNASVTVADIDSEVSIYLNNDENSDAQFEGDIKYLDASEFSGNATLVGNNRNNVITASAGGSTLWGGNGTSNDTLIGGEGDDLFIYQSGNGRDIIQGAGENDTVQLIGITLDEISVTATDSSLKLNFASGGSLSLDTNSGTTFNIDDTNYTYNNSENKFEEK